MVFLLLVSVMVYSQARTITGKLTDQNGAGLLGASVQVKGTNIGTVTDQNGDYSLSVPSRSSVLIFSYSGLGSQEITVGDQTAINVKLSATTSTMQEVVVVGYGTTKKSDLTGSVG